MESRERIILDSNGLMYKRLLQLGFAKDEWTWLQGEPLFRAAANAMKRLGDVENVSRLGKKLIQLSKRDKKTATKSSAPEDPTACE